MNVDGLVSYQVLTATTARTQTRKARWIFRRLEGQNQGDPGWTTGANDATDQDYMYTGDTFVSSYRKRRR